MKSHEGELVKEISKLQAMVLELRAGFSRALLELNQIQLGDTELQTQLEETRHGCNKRALHLETLVLSLREELEDVRCHIRQICDDQVKPEQANNSTAPQNDSTPGCSGMKDVGSNVNGVADSNTGAVSPPLHSAGGALLVHCYLQGLSAGRSSGRDAQVKAERLQSCSLQGRRQRVAVSLLRSEWDYVSSLGLLYDKYKATPTTSSNLDLHKAFAKHVDQMLQRHLQFRNCLEERLTLDQRSWAVGEDFLKLTGQENSAFCDAYLGYMTALASILTAEFSREQPDKPQHTQEEEEKESFRLLSLLLAPVSRLHAYLNTIQFLRSCSGSGHPDWVLLQESEQVLRNLCTRCHIILEREGRWVEGVGPVNSLSGRFLARSPNCGRSAFTKYRARPRAGTADCASSRSDATDCYAPISVPSNGHQTENCHLAVPQPFLPPTGILRNSRERVCDQLPSSSWPEGCSWDCRAGECPLMPLFMPTVRQPQQLLLNPCAPSMVGDLPGTAAQSLKSPSRLVERLCGSPGPDGRVCRSDLYSLPQRIDEGDTDADLGDASVFDYSSVTTCSPDDTLELRGESREDEDDEEDSEIPVLLKPSCSHSHPSGSTPNSQREGSVCMRWQIPRAAPLPPEVPVGGSGTLSRTKTLRRVPTGAFRPIWDAPYREGDAAPAKESTVSFSTTNQIINPQRQTKPSRSLYRSVCSSSPVGAADGIWNESEDSEGPCSNV
ncbi:rho guanine nucleotide exchange factor 33 [Astyanax mexicanus]|uniref:Rho guanine nucleotide exchange factor 33-like n=1 Tax=Astyanax mexicanus TaxID=7994 RepID=A0A8T2M053_ASTMX|nr:rho guanine nucleotide exchange factor 33 [Astyanax mexicanus]KAG9274986.1 rho guanine nucleotide exchange factor 33-like [Astyanax mexicanus]